MEDRKYSATLTMPRLEQNLQMSLDFLPIAADNSVPRAIHSGKMTEGGLYIPQEILDFSSQIVD
jgi:hypothetical protein